MLKDVNFTVEPGESLALIGINGSGKTTLLKIISQVTYQSAGRCTVAGRIGALLSVTSGLHPDLTGRENIFLYGAVLGMGRDDIRRKFDTIVEFAELGDAIDRQVKFYSMGMQMRLGFSIAAFLEPDILLVDEVLAVGDASFQQKCLRRIGEVVRDGTTLLYVSHDLASVEATCDRAVWLADAVVRAAGPDQGRGHPVPDVHRAERDAAHHQGGHRPVLKAELRATDGGQLRSECETEIRLVVNSPEKATRQLLHRHLPGTGVPDVRHRLHGHHARGRLRDHRASSGTCPCPRATTPCGRRSPASPRARGTRTCRGSRWPRSRRSAPSGWTARGVMVLSPGLRGRRVGDQLSRRPRHGAGHHARNR